MIRQFALAFLLLVSLVQSVFSQSLSVDADVTQRDVAEVLEWIGVLPAIRQVPQVVEMSLRGQLADVANPSAQVIQETIEQQYSDIESLQAQVVAYVLARVDKRTMARANTLLQQSVPQAIRKAHTVMQESSALADMNEYHRRMETQVAVSGRKEFLAEIDRVTRMTGIVVQIQTTVDKLINQRLSEEKIVPLAEEKFASQKREVRENYVRKQVQDLLMFVYREMRGSELREYSILMSDDSIQKLFDLSQQAIDVTLREQ